MAVPSPARSARDRSAPDRLVPDRAALARARLALWWEALWPVLWRGAALIGLFAALALFGLFDHLPFVLHCLLLLVFIGGLALALRGLPRALRPPSLLAARRRVEQASGLAHRPLEALDDHPAAGTDALSLALWRTHQNRLRAQLGPLKAGLPAPGLPRHDPFALRALVILLLVVGTAYAGALAPGRLLGALVPRPESGAGGVGPHFVAWATPPAHTRKAPVYLGAEGLAPGRILEIPAGTRITAQLNGVDHGAILVDQDRTPLKAVGGSAVSGEATIKGGHALVLAGGGDELAAWPLKVIPDAPPTVVFTSPPAASERRGLRLAFAAADDYGVTAVALRLTLGGGERAREVFDMPLGGGNQTSLKVTTFRDLTAHPWAGQSVTAELVATDALGQQGLSKPEQLVLPERSFDNPLAKAIIQQRKRYVANPAKRLDIARRLEDLASSMTYYRGRMRVYLGLAVAEARLVRSDEAGRTVDRMVVDLLWDIAIDLEEGRVASTENALRAAQDALEQALQSGASDDEIRRLMTELRQALTDHLQALTQEAMRNQIDPRSLQQLPSGRTMSPDDFARMMDEMQRLADSGAREAAQDLLAEMRDMLESLRAMQAMNDPSGGAKALRDGMKALQDMVGRQQDLRDETFGITGGRPGGPTRPGPGQRPDANGLPGPNGQPAPGGAEGEEPSSLGSPSLDDLATRQESLRRALGEAMRQLGETGQDIPGSLTEAERAMDAARQALGQGDGQGALGAQADALKALRQGTRELGQQLSQMLGMAPGQADDNGAPGGRDPLGRPRQTRRAGTGDDVQVPTQAEVKRVREILDELRRRAGERGRPQDELDYIDRLLRRF